MKKKILTLTLTVVLLLTLTFTLSSCGGPKTFTIDEFSIDLNSSYFDVTAIIPTEDIDTAFAAYLSLTERMIVFPTKAPDPDNEINLWDYVDAYADEMGGSISSNDDGIYTVEYSMASEGYDFDLISYIYDTDDGFWVVSFLSLGGEIDDKAADIEAYVDTIVID